MTMTLTLGWWLVPLAVTLVSLTAARVLGPHMQPQGGSMFPDVGGALLELLKYAAAVIVSIAAWLIWAVLT